MKRKKDNPSNYSVYFLKGFEARKDGFPETAYPHEISQPDSYSDYLRCAWIRGWHLAGIETTLPAEAMTECRDKRGRG